MELTGENVAPFHGRDETAPVLGFGADPAVRHRPEAIGVGEVGPARSQKTTSGIGGHSIPSELRHRKVLGEPGDRPSDDAETREPWAFFALLTEKLHAYADGQSWPSGLDPVDERATPSVFVNVSHSSREDSDAR